MAVFAYIYIQSFIVNQDYSVEMILDQVRFIIHPRLQRHCKYLIVSYLQISRSLGHEEQKMLYVKLGDILQHKLQGRF